MCPHYYFAEDHREFEISLNMLNLINCQKDFMPTIYRPTVSDHFANDKVLLLDLVNFS